ncbi:MAG: phosphoribosylformylglycinamidine cyclo-ligase, partial [Acidimicrobiia bacterium]
EIPRGYTRPVLMMSTDGVGTKLEIARQSNKWGGVGRDLVAMCVDDLAAAGAKPLGFVDYMAVGALDSERDSLIVASIAEGCALAGCALLGGETAVHPGVMPPDAVDLAGAVVGVVERGDELSPTRVAEGDVVIGLHSPNLRSNGFSLVRRVLGSQIEEYADMLLEPSVIYCPGVLEALETGGVHSAAHITGGGIAENLERALPPGLGTTIDTATWIPPSIFELLSDHGVGTEEMFGVFNMGIGFCLVADSGATQEILFILRSFDPSVIGVVAAGSGVELN